QQLIAGGWASEQGDCFCFKSGMARLRNSKKGPAGIGQMQRIGPSVLGRGQALDQAALFQPMDQGDEIGALDTEHLGNLGLLAARIVTNQDQNGIFGGTELELVKKGEEFLEHAELGAAQPVADSADRGL